MQAMLQKLVGSGELLLWEPTLPGDSCVRTMFITSEINDEMDPASWKDSSFGFRVSQLQADFDRFVSGDTIPVGMSPYEKGENAFLARVDPKEYGIWTLRSMAPKPALRVFGAFAVRDTFIALTLRERKALGGQGDRRWANAREAALAHWSRLFCGQKPLFGEHLDDYLSEKAITV